MKRLAITLVLLCSASGCSERAAVRAAPPAASTAPARPLSNVEVPKLEGRVNDRAILLTDAERSALSQKLAAHEKATGQQFALLTLESLKGIAIEDFSYTVANTWQLGSKGKDDGLLLVVAMNDRKSRIEVGRGLEAVIPNDLAARVLQEQLAPAFTKHEYAAGLDAAFDRLLFAARQAK